MAPAPPREGRDGLKRLLRVTDRFGLALGGAALLAYVFLVPNNEKKNAFREEKERWERRKSEKQLEERLRDSAKDA